MPGVSSHQHTITRARVWTQPRVLSVTQCRVSRVLTVASVAQWPPRERLLVQCCEGRTYFTGLGGLGCTWLYSGLIKAKHIMLKHSQLSPGPRPPLSWRWWWEGAELQTSFHSQLALKSPPETMKTHCGWRQILSTSSSRSRVLFDHHSYTPVVRGKGHFNIWAMH